MEYSSTFGQPHGHQLRGRTSSMHVPSRLSGGSISGVLPTPDPTIGSVISDEDVALQLMRLGDASNLSLGRTSTSTMDDALSGRAEAASSDEDSEDDESVDDEETLSPPVVAQPRSKQSHVSGPVRKRQRLTEAVVQSFDSADTSGEEYEDHNDGSFKGESDGLGPDALTRHVERSAKSKSIKSTASSVAGKSHALPRVPSLTKSKSKSSSSGKIPPSPYSMPPTARKASSTSTGNLTAQQGGDDEDLSSKPRCQRCRKSKKGCDRQRPCQRCKDAGIGIEGCVSEDEGNGRKGRYGRHMGVAVKKDEAFASVEDSYVLAGNGYHDDGSVDGGKKRKR